MICRVLGYSRQSYYKQGYDRSKQEAVWEKVRQMVCAKRKLLPKVGTRKLRQLLAHELAENRIKLGRDKLFDFLRRDGLLVRPPKRYVQTTDSRHWMRKWPNLVREITPRRAEQIWVSDITYIKTRQDGYCYLSMVTDAWSRKIMGYNLSRSLSAEHALSALRMALRNRLHPDRRLIHHSDRGHQYCSKEYVATAQANRIRMSMTENGDPYENALAERMNRTIKEEFCLDREVPSLDTASRCVSEAVQLYNTYRPHLALDGATPESVHK
jgi:transposase InsO family protein